MWPEFEITIEDESEYKRDISDSLANSLSLSNSLISRNRNDDTMNLDLDSFQVFSLILY